MKISSSREEELPTKQEGGVADDAAAATDSRIWPGLRNPRIVRVSRAFGGKDRHSKVSTVRGLRDRRVRLSVPTAIQLYDLQDRLGLNQPSKVVDWLLNATQHEIDKLPPLPMMPGNFIQFSHQSLMTPHEATPRSPSNHSISKKDLSDTTINAKEYVTLPKSTYYSDSSQRDIEREPHREGGLEKDSILGSNEVETQYNLNLHSSQLVAHDPIFRASQSFLPGSVSINAMPYSSYYNSDASNAYEGMHPSQMEIPPLLPSSLSLTTGSQSELRPSGSATLSMFPPYMTVSTGMDPRQLGNYIQMANLASQELQSHPMRTYLLSGSQAMRTFQSNMASKDYMSSQDHHES